MLLIECPYCGPRAEEEFRCGGEAHIQRPRQPQALSDAEWSDYLFMRTNPKGLHYERWQHAHGCRRWFNVARHTVTDEIFAVYPMGAPAAQIDVNEPAKPAVPPSLRLVSGAASGVAASAATPAVTPTGTAGATTAPENGATSGDETGQHPARGGR